MVAKTVTKAVAKVVTKAVVPTAIKRAIMNCGSSGSCCGVESDGSGSCIKEKEFLRWWWL